MSEQNEVQPDFSPVPVPFQLGVGVASNSETNEDFVVLNFQHQTGTNVFFLELGLIDGLIERLQSIKQQASSSLILPPQGIQVPTE